MKKTECWNSDNCRPFDIDSPLLNGRSPVTNQTVEIQMQVSFDGTNWFPLNAPIQVTATNADPTIKPVWVLFHNDFK